MNVKRGARESRFTLLLKLHYLLCNWPIRVVYTDY